MNIPVNQIAPVKSEGVISIAAPLDAVWHVLTRIDGWPSWQEDVTDSALQGELREGAVFRWKAGGIRFTSRIHTMKEKTMFGWTGETFGASAIHNWTFSERNGVTTIKVEESLQGFLPSLFRNYFQRKLERGMRKNLEELRSASENRVLE